MRNVRLQTHRLPQPAPRLGKGRERPWERGCVQERILEVRRDRPRLRPCPPSRPRGPASSRHLVGLLTHELERSHAFSPPRSPLKGALGDNGSNATALSSKPGNSPGSKIARTQRRGRPGITPEFPVCRRKAAAFSRPPASLAECTDRAEAVNRAGPFGRGRKVCQAALSGGKPCGSYGLLARSGDGCTRPRRTRRTDGAHGSLYLTRRLSCPGKKTINPPQAAAPPPPIAPMTPGASLCPSGNQGAAVTCGSLESRNGSTGLSQ